MRVPHERAHSQHCPCSCCQLGAAPGDVHYLPKGVRAVTRGGVALSLLAGMAEGFGCPSDRAGSAWSS